MFTFSATHKMDDEGRIIVRLETNLQVSDAEREYYESTDSDIMQDRMYSAISADCEVSADIPTHCMNDYNVPQVVKCAHERPEDVQADNAYGRQGDVNHGHMAKSLPGVKCEEHRQELNEQVHVLPFKSTYQETNWTNDADETIQVKQEMQEYPDGYDRSSEVTRHWVVCPGGVLKEVKAEHTSDVSDILTVEDSSENVERKLRTQTCTHHNNIHDEQLQLKLCTDHTCGVSSTRHDTVLKVQARTSKDVNNHCGELVHLSKHTVNETEHTCFKDFTCGNSIAQSGQLKQHELTHTGVKPFSCDTCGKSFALSRNLKRHEMIHTGDKPFTCETCGQSFARSECLKRHEMIHTGDKPFTCDTCGKSFSQYRLLKRHLWTHTDFKPYTCGTCGKFFAQSGKLKCHEMTHTGIKPYTCGTCGKSFTHSGNLKYHEMTHTGIKPFTCDTCGKSFAKSGNLKYHKITHTGVKPFTCDTCGKSFTLSGHLKRHEMIHTGGKRFTCGTCGRSYSQSGSLKRHNLSEHDTHRW